MKMNDDGTIDLVPDTPAGTKVSRRRILVWYLGQQGAAPDPYIYDGPDMDFKGNALKVRAIGRDEDGTLWFNDQIPALRIPLSALSKFIVEEKYQDFYAR